ncbi:MAG: hypothetical protein M1542_06430 [Thermotogae bacterium]|jgi:hypothetical protein|nr:hypothetical protein [Thermotogota bacterium]MCL5032857.1 hypothetical protein [Thermotogota bacterium]
MADYFFSYKKDQETKSQHEDNEAIEELLHEITHMIAMEILNELNGDVTTLSRQTKNDFKHILEEEISKFDSIEEVKYLGEYLIDIWRKTHEF